MFINLKNHTTFSLCKGAIKIKELVDKAKEFNMPAVGIMDINNLFGALEFSSTCKKSGIQPILGCELLVHIEPQNNNNSNNNIEDYFYKIPLIAKDDLGYKNLMYLASHAYLDRQSNASPHVSFDLLAQKSAGLIAFSGGVDGFLATNLVNDQEKYATELVNKFGDIFKDNFYIEINRHNLEAEVKVEKKLIKIAQDNNLPLIACNDVYFIEKKHA